MNNKRQYYMNLALERTGETRINSHGSIMKINKYNNSNDIIVKFENGYTTNVKYNQFLSGHVSNPYDKTVYNIGYIGEGKYTPSINGKTTIYYQTWKSMMQRCYCEKLHNRFPTYIKCLVCEEWLNFQNFSKWYDNNFYQISNEQMNLDKDIIHKGNKVYSPENCVFVPQCINILFEKNDGLRGQLPIGISLDKKLNSYQVHCNNNGKSVTLGRYKSIKDAFFVYKKYKEHLIKETAENFKNQIPDKLYSAMLNYKIDIQD